MKTKELHVESLDLKWTSEPFGPQVDLTPTFTWAVDPGMWIAPTRVVEIAFSMLS